MKKLLAIFFATFFCSLSCAEIIQVPSEYGDTPTGYWASPNSKAVVMSLPGGAGSFNIAGRNPPAPTWLLSTLHQDSAKGGGVDIVFVDSPFPIGPNISPRYTKEHLVRVESVVKFYKEKLHKPIYLMGHSNGTISLAEFLNRSPENQQLIAGAIFSGSRNETTLDGQLNLPILFLHHAEDPNGRWTSYDNAHSLYEKIKKVNKSSTEFESVHGGESGDPSEGGHHMYIGSFDEAAKYVENFISRQSLLGSGK